MYLDTLHITVFCKICCLVFIDNVYYFIVIRSVTTISRHIRVKHISCASKYIFIFELVVKNINIECIYSLLCNRIWCRFECMYFVQEYESWEQLGQGQNVAAINGSGRYLCPSWHRAIISRGKKVTEPHFKSCAP